MRIIMKKIEDISQNKEELKQIEDKQNKELDNKIEKIGNEHDKKVKHLNEEKPERLEAKIKNIEIPKIPEENLKI